MIASILVIEDNDLTARLYQGLLEKAGYNVLLAIDTRDAEQYLNNIEVDLIILDYELPDKIGVEWLRDLREYPLYVDLPVILVSFMHRDEDLRNDRFVWFMEKPMQPQHIVTAVEATIREFESR